ncbi:glycosyltransferase family 2 protein [Candidatus Protochlamydia phocaeensis]|uniref:glycosyltransferase family 2 protein n=1 Tax=Candidatus Protochlamydia phocaeensis TaxID=1414722 RepID=UPI000838284C|nr:glycosyltransferase family 2 protein [Candidatus Protochlamydia phocaeensis]
MKLIHQSQRVYQLLKNCVKPAFSYLKQGYQARLLKAHCLQFAKHLFRHIHSFGTALDKDYRDLGDLRGPRMQKLKSLTAGLHALLPADKHFSYSILICLSSQPHPERFRKSLLSALEQTAPHLDVLIGYGQGQPSKDIEHTVEDCRRAFPERLRTFPYSTVHQHEILNALAQEANGHYLFILDFEDWIRPDFLFRCEQLLRLVKDKGFSCIYTDEYEINDSDHPIPGKQIQKPHQLVFPYLFTNVIQKSLLIPRHLWALAGGIKPVRLEDRLWDLCLRLDLAGAYFHHLPFCLYARRAGHYYPPVKNPISFLEQLNAYSKSKELQWDWTEGYLPDSYRAIPTLASHPDVHVIIPFKNQKELTLKTVRSLLKQRGVQVKITAVDNASQDTSIGEEIRQLGGEVLLVSEPFNFSRLNNLAIERTQVAQDCPYVLFINNDVELEPDALHEMCRWIDQPRIGLVGCRLHYPNGLLQHGGIDLKRDAPAHQMIWNHSEKMASADRQRLTKIIRIADAVTAACALMKKDFFVEIGGFDEIWYPIAYSDTNLAVKIQAKGRLCLYTPYASGVHHESISRQYENIEDVEMSNWLHEQYLAQHLSEKITNDVYQASQF